MKDTQIKLYELKQSIFTCNYCSQISFTKIDDLIHSGQRIKNHTLSILKEKKLLENEFVYFH